MRANNIQSTLCIKVETSIIYKQIVRKFLAGMLVITGIAMQVVGQKPGTCPENLSQVKNVIMMIPDGTSTSVLSLARWYQSANSNELIWLNVDELVTGLVKTHCSDAPIGDSAPTGSTYATGMASQEGYVATYPQKTPNDIVPVDASLANMPAMTILEAAKLKGMATGLAVTCYFSHATPADFSAHSYNRSRNDWLVPQMVYNSIDVVFGGGTDYLVPGYRQYLAQNGWDVIIDDYPKFTSYSGKKVWGLFAKKELPYDIDRDPATTPSLAEMTKKAIEVLSKNENGFFLMVEGSKVDWAAHDNDAVGVVTDFIAFDKAVKEALDFARQDGNTAIVICPDHGNSAISMGNEASNSGYAQLSKKQLLKPLMSCKYTAEGFTMQLLQNRFDASAVRKMFAVDMGIDEVSEPDMWAIEQAMSKKSASALHGIVIKMMKTRNFIGFTTTGHTGEDVFLACYHPKGETLKGVVMNTEVNKYMCNLLGIESLADSTQKYFAGHKTLFPSDQYDISWDKSGALPSITVKSKKTKKTLTLNAFENKAVLVIPGKKKQTLQMKTVVVYVDRNEEFYLSRNLRNFLQ